MNEQLPITLHHQGLFEQSTAASERLFTMLEAWANFATMAAGWYGNEENVLSIHLTVMPEPVFLDHQVDNNDNWQAINQPQVTGLYKQQQQQVHCIFMLNKTQLNQLMSKENNPEDILRVCLTHQINALAKSLSLTPIK